MKISIVGTRGVPAKYGGFETFAEKLASRLCEKNEVLVVGELSNKGEIKKVSTINLNFDKSSNPILYYHKSIAKSIEWGAQKIIVCGVGGIFSVIFFKNKAEFFINPDGLEFRRKKWSLFKRSVIFVLYILTSIFGKHIICDSKAIQKYFSNVFLRYKNTYVAEYGAVIPKIENEKIDNKKLNNKILTKGSFYLAVARLEPENNIKLIIEGYVLSNTKKPLLIIGNRNSTYFIKELSKYSNEMIIFIDGVYDQSLLSYYRLNCFSHIHGHSVGGTNPSLLEAMAHNSIILSHDNPFNRDTIGYNFDKLFFKDKKELAKSISWLEDKNNAKKILEIKNLMLERIKTKFNWEIITNKYLKILKK